MSTKRILVIEDNPDLAYGLRNNLEIEGYDVEVAGDGTKGLARARTGKPDLVILDLMLPGFDGLEVCRRIQRRRAVAVIMLTARDSETDVLVGLGVGADDYVTKPFSPRELVARVQAVLRRAERAPAPEREPVRAGDVEVDPRTRRVSRAGRQVHLTPIEFDLLLELAARPGEVFDRERLLADVWGYRDGSGARTVDSHVRALRKKLGPDLIRTVHGVGYAMEVPR